MGVFGKGGGKGRVSGNWVLLVLSQLNNFTFAGTN